jgi:hypothetical protein
VVSATGPYNEQLILERIAGSSATQIPLQLATGGIGLGAMGVNSAGDHYDAARASGKTTDEALDIASTQGLTTFGSEYITNKLFGGNDDIIKKMFTVIRDVTTTKQNKLDVTMKSFLELDIYSQRGLLINLLS